MERSGYFASACVLLCVASAARPAQEQDWDLQRFQAEVFLADRAGGRDSAVAHLRQALAARPNHPDNIVLEFRIGISLSQHVDPGEFRAPDFLARREKRIAEALQVFEGILRKYKHMDYHERDSVILLGKYYRCATLVAEAAMQAAGCSPDHEQIRKHEWTALECLNQTWERRKKDWLAAPPPPEVKEDSPFGGTLARAKWESRYRHWQQRKERAAKGDCLDPIELELAKAAIRKYAYTVEKQGQAEVMRAMARIVEAFPGTPMAELAQERAEGPWGRQ
ncbi:MAG TPA: hypothetical protein VNE39_16455 [Planctomycetota bacterium]|nr:hypothetical protein [Planctomycetota bacterium]